MEELFDHDAGVTPVKGKGRKVRYVESQTVVQF